MRRTLSALVDFVVVCFAMPGATLGLAHRFFYGRPPAFWDMASSWILLWPAAALAYLVISALGWIVISRTGVAKLQTLSKITRALVAQLAVWLTLQPAPRPLRVPWYVLAGVPVVVALYAFTRVRLDRRRSKHALP